VFQGHFTKLYYVTVSLPEKNGKQCCLQFSAERMQAVTGFPWPKLEENSMHVTPITNGGTTSVVVEADHIIQINITQHRIANF